MDNLDKTESMLISVGGSSRLINENSILDTSVKNKQKNKINKSTLKKSKFSNSQQIESSHQQPLTQTSNNKILELANKNIDTKNA